MNQATIGVKEATKERFKRAAKGQYHDYFVNVLLNIYEATTPVERAEIISRRLLAYPNSERDEQQRQQAQE